MFAYLYRHTFIEYSNLLLRIIRRVLICTIVLSFSSACSDQVKYNKTTSSIVDKKASIRLAVLGDSDSHSYGDRLWFPENSGLRGGGYRRVTLQWTEVLDRLRGAEIDQGRWERRGVSARVARLASMLGIQLRTPEKEDFEFNFAWSGAVCGNLTERLHAQSYQLLRLMDEDPLGWKEGIVQVRIGINVLGKREFLDQSAREGLSPAIQAAVTECGKAISTTVNLLRVRHPEINIVLIGILDNSDWPPFFQYWQSSTEKINITLMLDAFDAQMRMLAASDSRIAFFDDRKWFKLYWGGRNSNGMPNYKQYDIAPGITVRNLQGDSPEHGVLMDGHVGTLHNAVFVRDFIDFLNKELGAGIRPVSNDELAKFSRSIVEGNL